MRTVLRRVGARTRKALHEAPAQALLTVSTHDAQDWFQHCSYLPQAER
ncbi:hypothetical protein [Ktedonospora formicarum]|nr:hypothetical protein [Ktedonospora formicarum]